MIDVENMKLEDLLAMAVRAEMEAEKAYSEIADGIKSPVLKETLMFLSREEGEHRASFEALLKRHFPDKEVRIPRDSEVPFPPITYENGTPVADVLQQAMEAEAQAYQFYTALWEKVGDGEMRSVLDDLRVAEKKHYETIKSELETEESIHNMLIELFK